MFDKKGFIAFVGGNSGASYANGLENIEKAYGVDIDHELTQTSCADLLKQIDADKKRLAGNDRKNRQNWYSHLKKYVEYRSGLPVEDQKQRFVAWLKQQPQRNNPSKTYSDVTANAAVSKLQSGLKTLGVPGYENVNCFAITDVNVFRKLHQACYAAATESDKELGHSDFRNGLDFYLQYLEETTGTPEDNAMLKKIRFIITHYKANFNAVMDRGEIDKWKAVDWYQNHWNPNDPNFSSMINNAFAPAKFLLDTGPNSQSYSQIRQFSQENPEIIKSAFLDLYDEKQPVGERITQFRSVFQHKIDDIAAIHPEWTKKLTSFQDLHAISVYLFFAYPDKYFIYKSSAYKAFAKYVGFQGTADSPDYNIRQLENLTQLCHLIITEAKKDAELMALVRTKLDKSCYQDTALHLLASDIVFYVNAYMLNENSLDVYWPSLKDYDPGITKDMWVSILQDTEVTTEDTLRLLNMFMELGGESSFNNLVETYGNQFYYKGTLQDFSTRVVSKVNCAECPKEYKEVAKYIIPFVGRMVMDGDIKRDSWKLRDELQAALDEISSPYAPGEQEDQMESVTDVGLNTILYGPPGTGKTYHTVIYAVAIIENKELNAVKSEDYQNVLNRYNEYKSQGRIEFTTFHQSYGYEEFIEGIRPVVDDGEDQEGSGNIRYAVQPGVFKKFCEKADRPSSVRTSASDLGISEDATIWKVSLEGTGDNPTRTECLKNDHIRIGWDGYGKDITDETDFSQDGGRVVLNAFMNKMQIGDIVLSCYSASTIDAIGVVTGDYEWHDEYQRLKRLRKVKWLVKGIQENILAMNGGTPMTLSSVYKLSNIAISDVYKLIETYQPAKIIPNSHKDNYVFIVDEINRGNISKVFGELITLIEESKRVGNAEGMKTVLPYSMKPFGVPKNVYIIGTMNTADRSIATIDTALRRRFEFKEMLPNPEVVAQISVGNLSIKELLVRMNRRISVLYDREHTIGHAYFMPLKEDNSIEMLADIFKNKVIPLLQEYFYEDYEKIRLVLGDNQKKDKKDQFILAKKINQSELFGSADIGLDDGFTYEINENAFTNPEAYRLI